MIDLPEGFDFEPMHDRVLLSIADRETKGGLVLPGSSAQKMDEAFVVRIGATKEEDWSQDAIKLSKGDRVLFFKGSPVEVEIGKKKFLMASIHDIFGRVKVPSQS